jgi:hypothetical protein
VPVAGARVVVRSFPRGSARPGEPVGRATTAADGSVALLLPAGRYAVAAAHEDESRAVTITLEHAGRAMLALESRGRRVVLTVEVALSDGRAVENGCVDVLTVPGGALAARGSTDAEGIAALSLPPGAYEVRVGDAAAKTYIEADTLLRVTADAAPRALAAPAAVTRYHQRVRAATGYAAPFDVAHLRDDIWN